MNTAMSCERVDVLRVLDAEIARAGSEAYQAGRDLIEVRAAVAELIDKAREVLGRITDHFDDQQDATCQTCKALFDLRETVSRIQPDGQG